MNLQEEWRPVVGFPDYMVSDRGRVASRRRGSFRLLKPWTNANGYLYINIGGRAGRKRTVHSLVAEAFHGPRPEGMEVRHLDGSRQNNIPSNLQFGSNSENAYDRVRHGTHAMVNRTHCPAGHEYSPDNTRYYDGRRFCRTCPRERYQRQMLRAASVPTGRAA